MLSCARRGVGDCERKEGKGGGEGAKEEKKEKKAAARGVGCLHASVGQGEK